MTKTKQAKRLKRKKAIQKKLNIQRNGLSYSKKQALKEKKSISYR